MISFATILLKLVVYFDADISLVIWLYYRSSTQYIKDFRISIEMISKSLGQLIYGKVIPIMEIIENRNLQLVAV